MMVSLLLLLLLYTVSGFNNNPPLCLHRTDQLRHTVSLLSGGIEEDPLETDRRQNNGQTKRTISYTSFSRRSQPSSPKSSSKNNGNERKAKTTETGPGIGLQLNDPKGRVLVRHATASAQYSVDHFKGKKKKIIRPWSSGRKKRKTQHTLGVARDAYGEELEVEIKNKLKKKRLVMARTNSLNGTQEVAKALILGGTKAKVPVTPTSTGDAERIDDDVNVNVDDEPSLVRHISTTDKVDLKENRGDKPNLVRHVNAMSITKEDNNEDEPKFYGREVLSESVNVEAEQRLGRTNSASPSQSSLKKEPKLVKPNFVKRKTEGPKLVRATIIKEEVDEPKLVRANIVQNEVQEPKLMRANAVRGKTKRLDRIAPIESSQKKKRFKKKLIRPVIEKKKQISNSKNFVKPYPVGRKDNGVSVGSHFLKDKLPEKNLIRPAVTEKKMTPLSKKTLKPDRMGDKNIDTSSSRRLVAPSSSTSNMTNLPVADLMYGTNPSTFSPTDVPTGAKPKRLVRPALATDAAKSSVDIVQDKKTSNRVEPKRLVRAAKNNVYDAKSASVGNIEKPKEFVNRSTKTSSDSSVTETSPENSGTNSEKKLKRVEQEKKLNVDGRQRKKYVQTAVSMMNNVPNWNNVEPITVNVENKEKDDGVGEKNESYPNSKRNYVKPTSSMMRNAPNWDSIESTVKTSNPASVNVGLSVLRRKDKDIKGGNNAKINASKEKKIGTKKMYVQPIASVMDSAPDWDAVKPALTTSNPSVINVDLQVLERKTKGNVENQDKNSTEIRKKYIQPTASVMDNVPDWDIVKPASTTSNPAVINTDESKHREEKHLVRAQSSGSGSETTAEEDASTHRKGRLDEEEISMFAMTPAAAVSKRQQMKAKSYIAFTREVPVASAQNAIEDEETKTILPASIAHAAGSSKLLSDGWTPTAHFPKEKLSPDDSSVENQKSFTKAVDKSKRKPQIGTMKSPDDSLPRPSGIIPLTVSEKSLWFRADHALEPMEDDDVDDLLGVNDEKYGDVSVSDISSSRDKSIEESEKKKLIPYDGSTGDTTKHDDTHVLSDILRLDKKINPSQQVDQEEGKGK